VFAILILNTAIIFPVLLNAVEVHAYGGYLTTNSCLPDEISEKMNMVEALKTESIS